MQPTDLTARIIEWLSRDEQRLLDFMAMTGHDPHTMMQEIDSPALHLAALEHLMGDEALLLQFCADTGIRPEECVAAWHGGNDGMPDDFTDDDFMDT